MVFLKSTTLILNKKQHTEIILVKNTLTMFVNIVLDI